MKKRIFLLLAGLMLLGLAACGTQDTANSQPSEAPSAEAENPSAAQRPV